MSNASVYADAYAAGQTTLAAPAPFVGPNGRAEVMPSGNMKITPNYPGMSVEIAPAGALAFANWVTTNFT
jgi:hypothetical protein